jgi:hypothetical protein
MKSYFTEDELKCPCCGLYNIEEDFLERINFLRYTVGQPLIVNSACRCEEHNKKEGGKETSDHLTGEGIDISCRNSSLRFKILQAAFKVGFRRIGVAKTFIHLGSRFENPQEVLWPY